MKCILVLVSLVISQVALAGKLRSEDSSLQIGSQIGSKNKVVTFAKGGPSAWEPQYPSTTAEGENRNSPSDDPPGAWQPQYASSQRDRQGESKQENSDRDRKHATEKSDEKAAKSDSEGQEQNNTEVESVEQNTNESSSANDDDNTNESSSTNDDDSNDRSNGRSGNQTDEKDKKRKDERHKDNKSTENSTSDREGAAGSNKTNESKGNSTSIRRDKNNKTEKQVSPKSPWQEFLPSCREKLKHLVKVAEASYTRPQIENVLQSECELDAEFPSIRDRFFDRRKECKAFAHALAKARTAEMKGESEAYDDCCKLWWKEAHEDTVGLVQHASNSHFWLWVFLSMLALGLVVAVVMNHFES